MDVPTPGLNPPLWRLLTTNRAQIPGLPRSGECPRPYCACNVGVAGGRLQPQHLLLERAQRDLLTPGQACGAGAEREHPLLTSVTPIGIAPGPAVLQSAAPRLTGLGCVYSWAGAARVRPLTLADPGADVAALAQLQARHCPLSHPVEVLASWLFTVVGTGKE